MEFYSFLDISSHLFTEQEVLSAAGGEEVSEHFLQSGCLFTLQTFLQAALFHVMLSAWGTRKIHVVWRI